MLLLDDGDATAGSPLVSAWHRDHAGAPEPVTLVMNAMGYDAMAVGNHEFDFGPAALESTRAAAKLPVPRRQRRARRRLARVPAPRSCGSCRTACASA